MDNLIKGKTLKHYDMLIEENNDPVYDSEEMKEYMKKWDGQRFLNAMKLDLNKAVLEVGVGTGRIAINVVPFCRVFTGIDFSTKTIERAKKNLAYENVILICDDFSKYDFTSKYDVVYSSLTFMHFKNKKDTILKIYDLINENGRFVLSIDKNQSSTINNGNRIIEIYPDDPIATEKYIVNSKMKVIDKFETDFAIIFVAMK